MLNDIEEILYDEEQIKQKVKELGLLLSQRFAGCNPLVVCILKGSFIFMADIVKAMEIPLEVDFMTVSSYGQATQTSGVIKITKDLGSSVQDRDVIIVEDIIDSGLTLKYLSEDLKQRQARSVTIVTLFDKPSGRRVKLEADYTGFILPDAFVVGYGLDYAEKYRNLPLIGILRAEVYNK